MTKLSKKRRLKRARAHAHRLDHRIGKAVPARGYLAKVAFDLLDESKDGIKIPAAETPTRAACPSCGYRQKVRKDGTMSRHDVGSETARECPGSGKQWNDG